MTLDAAEALTNAVIGLLASWLVTWLLLGFTPAASAGITAGFFALSFTRAFVLRRIFRGMTSPTIHWLRRDG